MGEGVQEGVKAPNPMMVRTEEEEAGAEAEGGAEEVARRRNRLRETRTEYLMGRPGGGILIVRLRTLEKHLGV